MHIIKRNGSKERFYVKKIINAIMLAMDETEKGKDYHMALKIGNRIYDYYKGNEITPTVEEVQDMVEEKLAKYGRFDVAIRF